MRRSVDVGPGFGRCRTSSRGCGGSQLLSICILEPLSNGTTVRESVWADKVKTGDLAIGPASERVRWGEPKLMGSSHYWNGLSQALLVALRLESRHL